MSQGRDSDLRALLTSLLILSGLALPYCVNLGVSSLWDANEAFYAETPREMMESGDYLSPRFNYQARAQKPPFTYWAILACYRLFGVGEFSVRLPGAVAAIGTILFVFGIGTLLFSRTAGLMAAIVVATTFRVFVLARKLPIDILLLFWVLGAAYFALKGLKDSSRWNWAGAYISAAFGFLTKGPVAVLIPAASVCIWMFAGRKAPRPRVYPFMGTALMMAVAMPYYSLTYLQHGWDYIAPFFLKDNLGRFASESFGPARGPFFYFATCLADFLPWSLLSLAAIAAVCVRERSLGWLRQLSFGFPIIWCGFVFLLFSVSKNKQEYYVAPIYPMMAVFLAGVLDRLRNRTPEPAADRTARLWKAAFLMVSLLFVVAAFTVAFLLRRILAGIPALPGFVPAGVLFAGALVIAAGAVRRRWMVCFASLGATLWLLFGSFAYFYLPPMEALRPVKEFCSVIRSQALPGDEAGYFRITLPSMAYYLRRPIFEEFERDAMIQRLRSSTRIFCIMGEQEYKYLAAGGDLPLYELDRRPRLNTQLRPLLESALGAREALLLVSNRPSARERTQEGQAAQ